MKTSLLLAVLFFAAPQLALADHTWLQEQLSITDGSPHGMSVYKDHEPSFANEGPQGRLGTLPNERSTSSDKSWFECQRQITDASPDPLGC
jgi:hypothetical protein